MTFTSPNEFTAYISARLALLIDAITRVGAQQLSIQFEDNDHAWDVLSWLLENDLRRAAWLGDEMPDDASISAALRHVQSRAPRLLEHAPSVTAFHDALEARRVRNADAIAAKLTQTERRREWAKLPAPNKRN